MSREKAKGKGLEAKETKEAEGGTEWSTKFYSPETDAATKDEMAGEIADMLWREQLMRTLEGPGRTVKVRDAARAVHQSLHAKVVAWLEHPENTGISRGREFATHLIEMWDGINYQPRATRKSLLILVAQQIAEFHRNDARSPTASDNLKLLVEAYEALIRKGAKPELKDLAGRQASEYLPDEIRERLESASAAVPKKIG